MKEKKFFLVILSVGTVFFSVIASTVKWQVNNCKKFVIAFFAVCVKKYTKDDTQRSVKKNTANSATFILSMLINRSLGIIILCLEDIKL